jgi:hypothetical protein
MHSASTDSLLQNTLDWAMERMRQKGYVVKSKVTLDVEPTLSIMGYARKEGQVHRIMISEWALDSEMLGGLVLHELSHVYFAERGACTHDSKVLDQVLDELKEKDGLRAKEMECLVDAFMHLQNVLVDDIVFAVMGEKEQDTARRFFAEWVSDRPSGDPVTDAGLVSRNAFAVASLRRRKMLDWGSEASQGDSEIYFRNKSLLDALGPHAQAEFDWLEKFLEDSDAGWDEQHFRASLEAYFDRIVGLMRSASKLDDLR